MMEFRNAIRLMSLCCSGVFVSVSYAGDQVRTPVTSCDTKVGATGDVIDPLVEFSRCRNWTLDAQRPGRKNNDAEVCGTLLQSDGGLVGLTASRPDFTTNSAEDERFEPVRHCRGYWLGEDMPLGAGTSNGEFSSMIELGQFGFRSYNVAVGSGTERKPLWIVFGQYDLNSIDFDGYRIIDAAHCLRTGFAPIARRDENVLMWSGTVAHGLYRRGNDALIIAGHEIRSKQTSRDAYLTLEAYVVDGVSGGVQRLCRWTSRSLVSK